MINNMENKIYRHGDLAFTEERINTDGLTKVGTDKYVLAEGETTGHKHVITAEKGTVDIYKDSNNELVLVIDGKAIVTHEEHKPIEFYSGTYRMKHQQEYNYFEMQSNQVID